MEAALTLGLPGVFDELDSRIEEFVLRGQHDNLDTPEITVVEADVATIGVFNSERCRHVCGYLN